MKEETKQITIVIGLTLLVSFIQGYISIEFLGEYGLLVFCFLPFFIGFFPVWIYGRKFELSRNESYKLSLLTLLLSLIGLLVFAIEGLFCIIMSLPLIIPICLLGSYLGYRKTKAYRHAMTFPVLVLLSFAFLGFDYTSSGLKLIPVTTKVEVNAPITTVWENVIRFEKMNTPEDWLFKSGIAYPTEAVIVGEGPGAVRYCKFSTGDFVEPITRWEPPTRLEFSVESQPVPMNEWNPFHKIHPPHLDGYFRSRKGSFNLIETGMNKTLLVGTTYYTVDIHPQGYWSLWSDFIIHKIHQRVLNHIKILAEAKK